MLHPDVIHQMRTQMTSGSWRAGNSPATERANTAYGCHEAERFHYFGSVPGLLTTEPPSFLSYAFVFKDTENEKTVLAPENKVEEMDQQTIREKRNKKKGGGGD